MLRKTRFMSFPSVPLYGIPYSGIFIGNPLMEFKLKSWISACLPVERVAELLSLSFRTTFFVVRNLYVTLS
ncbi:hypothetical protein C0389_01705 [bacterium]|nr:hypothetical protein [bacterium]